MIQLEEDKRDLERQLRETKANAEAAEKKLNEQRQVEERKHMEEINFLKKTNQQLKVRDDHSPFSLLNSSSLGSIGRIDRPEEIASRRFWTFLYTLIGRTTAITCFVVDLIFLSLAFPTENKLEQKPSLSS